MGNNILRSALRVVLRKNAYLHLHGLVNNPADGHFIAFGDAFDDALGDVANAGDSEDVRTSAMIRAAEGVKAAKNPPPIPRPQVQRGPRARIARAPAAVQQAVHARLNSAQVARRDAAEAARVKEVARLGTHTAANTASVVRVMPTGAERGEFVRERKKIKDFDALAQIVVEGLDQKIAAVDAKLVKDRQVMRKARSNASLTVLEEAKQLHHDGNVPHAARITAWEKANNDEPLNAVELAALAQVLVDRRNGNEHNRAKLVAERDQIMQAQGAAKAELDAKLQEQVKVIRGRRVAAGLRAPEKKPLGHQWPHTAGSHTYSDWAPNTTNGDAGAHLDAGGSVWDAPVDNLGDTLYDALNNSDRFAMPDGTARFTAKKSPGGINDQGNSRGTQIVTDHLTGDRFVLKDANFFGHEPVQETYAAMMLNGLGIPSPAVRYGDNPKVERPVHSLIMQHAEQALPGADMAKSKVTADNVTRYVDIVLGDMLIGNKDRHNGNVIWVAPDERSSVGKMDAIPFPIDNGMALYGDFTVRTSPASIGPLRMFAAASPANADLVREAVRDFYRRLGDPNIDETMQKWTDDWNAIHGAPDVPFNVRGRGANSFKEAQDRANRLRKEMLRSMQDVLDSLGV